MIIVKFSLFFFVWWCVTWLQKIFDGIELYGVILQSNQSIDEKNKLNYMKNKRNTFLYAKNTVQVTILNTT